MRKEENESVRWGPGGVRFPTTITANSAHCSSLKLDSVVFFFLILYYGIVRYVTPCSVKVKNIHVCIFPLDPQSLYN